MPLSFAEQKACEVSELDGFQEFSLKCLRKDAIELASHIGHGTPIFSTYTKHDGSHIDGMLRMLDWLVHPSTKEVMTPCDWALSTISIYLHDLGMLVTSEEWNNRESDPDYCHFRSSLADDATAIDFKGRLNAIPKGDREAFLYEEFVRRTHADRIYEWITNPTSHKIGKILSGHLEKLPSRFKTHLANLCLSHHRDDIGNTVKYPLREPFCSTPGGHANVQFCAVLLRTSDLLHITKDRTPSVSYQILNITDPVGVKAWRTHMSTFAVTPNVNVNKIISTRLDQLAIEITADFDSEDGFFPLSEYLTYAEGQIRQSREWIKKSQQDTNGADYVFPWSKIRRNIRVEGHEPELFRFELDRDRLLNMLVGHTLYNDPRVAIRELLQNALDATRLRRLQVNDVTEPIIVSWSGNTSKLSVIDPGTGMNIDVIRDHLLTVGSSYYSSDAVTEKFPNFSPISRFGIGLLTCFMLSDNIEIVTRTESEAHRLRMSSVRSDYLIQQIEPTHPSLNDVPRTGTRVTLDIRPAVSLDYDALLNTLQYWIILPSHPVLLRSNSKDISIGYSSLEEATMAQLVPIDRRDSSKPTLLKSNLGSEKYELAFATETTHLTWWSPFDTRPSHPPAVCVEGIRVDEQIPGLQPKTHMILSVNGNPRFRTTVSRSALERDSEYSRVAERIVDMVSEFSERQVADVESRESRPLSQASSAARHLYTNFLNRMNNEDRQQQLATRFMDIKSCVIEEVVGDDVNRRLISQNELKEIKTIFTIESRVANSLGTISRDLGREIPIFKFLEALAPDLLDEEFSPLLMEPERLIVPLADTHNPVSVRFNRHQQQTIVGWKEGAMPLLPEIVPEVYPIHDLLDGASSSMEEQAVTRFAHKALNQYTGPIAVCDLDGDDENISIVGTKIMALVSNKWVGAEMHHKLCELAISGVDDNNVTLLIGMWRYATSLRTMPHDDVLELYEKIWSQVLNSVEEMHSIDHSWRQWKFQDFIDIDAYFSASRYWFDW